MAGYSKETERQNKALKSILRGETPEKRVMVGYNSGKEPEKQGDIISPLSDVMKEARMPWFCPECNKTMKIQLDDKMWRLYGHCFDCQIKIETKLRATGEYEEWEKNKLKENKKSYVKDMLQGLDSWENESMPDIHNSVGLEQVELQKEQWNSN
ncbi:uncharacterized protein METZ01_LOCUS403336, partial [marine metagenome]